MGSGQLGWEKSARSAVQTRRITFQPAQALPTNISVLIFCTIVAIPIFQNALSFPVTSRVCGFGFCLGWVQGSRARIPGTSAASTGSSTPGERRKRVAPANFWTASLMVNHQFFSPHRARIAQPLSRTLRYFCVGFGNLTAWSLFWNVVLIQRINYYICFRNSRSA